MAPGGKWYQRAISTPNGFVFDATVRYPVTDAAT